MADLLGEEGPLATHIKGFAPRRPQQEMAEAVRKALKENKS